MVDDILSEIKQCEIDERKIVEFDSEYDFMQLSVDLTIEVGQYVCLAASILPGDRKAWSRDEAILGGHLIRLFKLISAFLDQTCQRRREMTVVVGRMAFECIINLKYLLKNASPNLFTSYIHYSLKHEKRLRAEILANIAKRGGEILNIEQRMLRSIDKAFKTSEVAPDAVEPKNLKNWGGKNLFEKAKDVGLEEAYLAAIGGPSHSVHGNWQELLEYNIELTDGGFVPDLDWHTPRPQLGSAICYQALIVTIEYLEYLRYLSPSKIEEIIKKLEQLLARVILLDQLHEKFLTDKHKMANTGVDSDAAETAAQVTT
ncbi:hypothetical protein JWG42_14030 [Desulfoprunum benzoelyticum]|uniref:Uncharacterized protein n=2 Tax=Desulfoprunum benzoelyticum TaxID=1506996 RepID=A0A840UX74_9BACT|nr:DUF5677 domain-containing protein [Desulfoprunum benzoelyticum]MBB5349523.1 hypothetical protein [Desulfoprunum benzoelyticum]MBM9531274.1 hypothetical protein [Desulfoprunum benzoelyticum]